MPYIITPNSAKKFSADNCMTNQYIFNRVSTD